MPHEKVADFARRLPSAELGVGGVTHFDGPSDEKGLPDYVRDKVMEWRTLPDDLSMARAVHAFTNEVIRPNYYGNTYLMGTDPRETFSQTSPSGLCLEYQEANAELMALSGVDPERIYKVQGLFLFSEKGKEPVARGHASTILETRDGKYYLVDNNLSGVVPFDPENPRVEGIAKKSGKPESIELVGTYRLETEAGASIDEFNPSDKRREYTRTMREQHGSDVADLGPLQRAIKQLRSDVDFSAHQVGNMMQNPHLPHSRPSKSNNFMPD